MKHLDIDRIITAVNTIRNDGQTGSFIELFGNRFIHGQGTSQHSGSLIGNVQQFEQTLNSSIFAIWSVQDDQRKVDLAGVLDQPGQIGLRIVLQDIVFIFVECFVDLLTAVQ